MGDNSVTDHLWKKVWSVFCSRKIIYFVKNRGWKGGGDGWKICSWKQKFWSKSFENKNELMNFGGKENEAIISV